MMVVPCKSCDKRGCGPYHDKCEKYQAYKREVESYKKKRYVEKNTKDYIYNAIRRMKVS